MFRLPIEFYIASPYAYRGSKSRPIKKVSLHFYFKNSWNFAFFYISFICLRVLIFFVKRYFSIIPVCFPVSKTYWLFLCVFISKRGQFIICLGELGQFTKYVIIIGLFWTENKSDKKWPSGGEVKGVPDSS